MKTLITSILLLAYLSADAKDMHEYLGETQDLARQGEHEKALDRFIWFHNNALEHEPAMYGVRLSFALSYWKELGKVYPPALKAMKEIRDEKTALLEDGKGDRSLFHDVQSLNETLEENEKTVQLFKQIDGDDPERAKQFWAIASDPVIEANNYDLARKYIGNPVREFRKVKESYDQNTALYDDPRIGGESFVAYNENRLAEESLKLIELALAFDDENAAKEIQKKALALVEDSRLRDALKDQDPEQDEPQ